MVLESTDARNNFEDLSGLKIQPADNPYKALIQACNYDEVLLRSLLLGNMPCTTTFCRPSSWCRLPKIRIVMIADNHNRPKSSLCTQRTG